MYSHVPLTIEGNYIDHLATSECSTGKPLVLSFIFYDKDCFRQSKALRWQDNTPCHTIKTSEEQCDMRSDKELKRLTRPQSCPGPSSIRHARASPIHRGLTQQPKCLKRSTTNTSVLDTTRHAVYV